MKVTIKDIAEKCGVSVGTVDRSLNNRYGVNDEVKKRVLEVAKELNYRPNHLGRSLATGRTMSIGVISLDLYNNFFPTFIDSIEKYAKKSGYFINLILSHSESSLEVEGMRFFAERNVDGVILFPICTGNEHVNFLKKLEIPIITILNKISDEFMHIGLDDKSAIAAAVEYLAEKKYDEIIYVSASVSQQESEEKNVYLLKQRLDGYLEGLEKSAPGLKSVVLQGSTERRAFAESFAPKDTRVCFLCSCDSIALDLSRLLRERGLHAPKDFGIMGYDNIEVLNYISPKLTTIDYNIDKLAKSAFESLLQIIKTGKSGKDVFLDYRIIEGETTA